jgi:hypothetical protein
MSRETGSLYQRSVCEGLGTCLLVAAVVGSHIGKDSLPVAFFLAGLVDPSYHQV